MHIANKNNPHNVTKEQVGLSSVANERQYSAQNPPPYPVKSVDGMTGAVSLAGKYIQYQGDNVMAWYQDLLDLVPSAFENIPERIKYYL